MNYLKKAFALTMIFGIVVTLSACGEKDLSGSKYLGTWVATSGELAGVQTEVQVIYTITLNPDGTATEVTDSLNEDFKWDEEKNGVVLKQSGGKVYMVEDGNGGLYIEQEGVVISFQRQ